MLYPARTVPSILIWLCAAAFGGALLTGCASSPPKPAVDYKSDYDFARVKTVAYYQNSGHVIGDNPLQLSDMQHDRIDEALAFALRNKGLRIVDDAAQADLLLSWHLVTQEKTDVRTWETPAMGWGGYNRYSAYSCWSCGATQTEVSVQNYTQGTFIVDLIDPGLKKSVWRAVIQSRLKGQLQSDQDKYNATATEIFATFPPGQPTAPD